MTLSPGTVYLVGAGPGAADLITLRGLRVLRGATVVFHDALAGPELLAEASLGAELVPVGKRGYCVGSTSQDQINDLLVRYALAGHVVCRLKGGDPGIFGRGGEEALACGAAGVPVEIVPGVTAALGAAASAGVSLTHRNFGQTVAFVTGHHDPESSALDWAALAQMATLVIYMGVRHAPASLEKLVAAGLAPETPTMLVSAATTPHEASITSTACELAGRLGEVDNSQPAVLIVGAVVASRAGLAGVLADAPSLRIQ